MSEQQTEELFAPESVAMDSPRLAWIKRHNVLTWYSPDAPDGPTWYAGINAGSFEFTGTADFFFQAFVNCRRGIYGEGETEHEAIADMAEGGNMPLWNEEAR